MPEATEYDRAYAICKLQASVDGAFPEELMRSWFAAAWDLCATAIGLVYPARAVVERVIVRLDGSFSLTYRPSSDVKLFDGYTHVMTLPPSLERSFCDRSLCCLCNLTAHYMVGEDLCEVPPRFLQAVARVFAYIAENRGDSGDEQVLRKSGALSFLGPDLTYVA